MAKTIIGILEIITKCVLQNHCQKVKHLDSDSTGKMLHVFKSASPVVLKNTSFFTLYGYNSTCREKSLFLLLLLYYISICTFLYAFICVDHQMINLNLLLKIEIILEKNILYNR